MEEDLLCPFHYFGISDVALVNEKILRLEKLMEEILIFLQATKE